MDNKVGEAGQALIATYASFEKELQLDSPFLYNGNKGGSNFAHNDDDYDAYWYHSDHLGSSNFITNIVGEISQHMEYTAFGEMFVEEHKNSNNSSYKFNAKELDEETGNYYYGARYYDPKWSVWLSVDPMAEKYPGWSPYNYTLNNPVRYTDPTGMVVEEGSKEEWNKQKNAIIERRDKLQTRIDDLTAKAERKGWSDEKLQKKIGNKGIRAHLLNSSINTLGNLEDSDQVYSLSVVSGEAGETTLKDGVINFQFDGTTSNFIHETTHGGQFESGDYMFSVDGGMGVFADVYDEMNAYINQYAYDPNSLGGRNLSGITPSWIKTIKDNNNKLLYGDNVSNFPLNTNSTTRQLQQAYPNHKELQSIPKSELNLKLKQYMNVYNK